MNKVVLITGASSGIGLHTAKLFQTKNWKVAATMREPEKAVDLEKIVDIECLRLDVTDVDSIKAAVAATLEKFGRIDAVVNNAGFAVVGPFEAATEEQIKRQFETNVFGVMNVCREILPYFRGERRGTIVNVASMGGRVTFPLYSIYHASKWALEGFSESLQYEVKDFGIKIKIIEPGPIKTDFYQRSMSISTKEGLTAYDNFVARAMPNLQLAGEAGPDGSVVAEVIYQSVNDDSWQMRYPVNSRLILAARRLLPDSVFLRMVRMAVLK
ncbi:MAG TPA: SDR family oxidoreductase [Pyrinomonadaceae bacterium]|nr:SDR family oxidoreductase [Pyrinomonadaceae bacterium]